MVKFIFIVSLRFMAGISFGQTAPTLNTEAEVWSWLSGHTFKASIEGDFDMFFSIETLDQKPVLVLSNANGKRKLFSSLAIEGQGTSRMLIGFGEENNALEVGITPEGYLTTAGMVFRPVE